MTIARLTRLAPVEIGFRIDPLLPVIPLSMEVDRAGCAASHAHPRGQLIYASRGVMRVICGRGIWLVPPSQAVWVAPHEEHEVYFPGEVWLRNLFIDPSVCRGLPKRCTVLKVSPLLRELVATAARIGDRYGPKTPQWRLMRVLLDELRAANETKLQLPMAQDPRVVRVIEALQANPSDERELAEWGKFAGASERTIARLFVSETGMTFGAWRTRLHLQETIERLDAGQSVTRIALDLGYRSVSAFSEMFRRELGVSPSKYGKP